VLYFENGRKQVEGAFKNGNWDGTVKTYFESGALMYEDEYKDGRQLSRKSYKKNGKLQYEKKF